MIDEGDGSEGGDKAESRAGHGIGQQRRSSLVELGRVAAARPKPIRVHKPHVSNEAQCCLLLSLCPLVLLVTATKSPHV